MKTFNTKKTLAAVALAAATLTAPALSHAGEYYPANNYGDCATNTQEQVTAGVLGAVVGGVLGSQVSGNGARTEGSVIGAIAGAAAGAAIADGANDCDKIREGRGYSTSYQPVPAGATYRRGTQSRRTVYTSPRVTTVHHRGYSNRGYGYNDRGYGYNNRAYNRLERVDRRIRNLRVERSRLKQDQRYYGYDRRTQRRLDNIAYELAELKQKRKRIKHNIRRY